MILLYCSIAWVILSFPLGIMVGRAIHKMNPCEDEL